MGFVFGGLVSLSTGAGSRVGDAGEASIDAVVSKILALVRFSLMGSFMLVRGDFIDLHDFLFVGYFFDECCHRVDWCELCDRDDLLLLPHRINFLVPKRSKDVAKTSDKIKLVGRGDV